MESRISLKFACLTLATAFLTTSGAVAQEAAEAATAAENEGAAQAQASGEATSAVMPSSKAFRFLPLMQCQECRGGTLELQLPGEEKWTKVSEPGRYYPFGSVIRLAGDAAAKPFARFGIGPEASITLSGNSSVATRAIAIGEETRTILLRSGTVGLDLPRTLKDGLLSVVTPDFVCKNIAGESRFDCAEVDHGREVTLRVITGSLALTGRHYAFANVGVADQLRIFIAGDALLTAIYGESGDAKATLNCGVKSVIDPETGAPRDEAQTIEYALSPKCAVKIWRKVSGAEAGGSGRMAVAVQTFDAQGNDKNFRAFFEGRANVNSGELVPAEVVKVEKADAQKPAEGEEAQGQQEGAENSAEAAPAENAAAATDA